MSAVKQTRLVFLLQLIVFLLYCYTAFEWLLFRYNILTGCSNKTWVRIMTEAKIMYQNGVVVKVVKFKKLTSFFKVFWASITDFRKNSKIQFFSHFFPIFKCSWSDLYSRYSRRYAWLIFSTIQLWVIVMHHGSTQALKCLNWNNSHFRLFIQGDPTSLE